MIFLDKVHLKFIKKKKENKTMRCLDQIHGKKNAKQITKPTHKVNMKKKNNKIKGNQQERRFILYDKKNKNKRKKLKTI